MSETEPLSNPESVPSKIQPIIDRMTVIEHSDVVSLLDAQAAVDPRAGIIIAPLPGEQFPPITSSEGQEYDFYVARVLPPNDENPNYVNPHVHYHGEEPYRFLTGTEGEMNAGRVVDGEVVWSPSKKVGPGDFVEIQEGEVHSFRNNGSGPADFIFACPKSHLVDHSEENPEGDRYFTRDLVNGTPPWYPK